MQVHNCLWECYTRVLPAVACFFGRGGKIGTSMPFQGAFSSRISTRKESFLV